VHSTTVIDLNWLGRPRSIACALVRSQDSFALIDPGPSSTLATLREELQRQGTSISELNSILLTHIHLDHAGATGALVRENPNLKVYVHARGVPHLLDPAKLLQSASRLWGDELPRLFGEFLPVPAANLYSLDGGETLLLGSRQLGVLYTPGHASHHVTYFDPAEAVAYVGDNAGISINGHPFALPVTPPPDISIELWDASLAAIARLEPKRIFLTHFSYSENPSVHIANYRERLHRWRDLSAGILAGTLKDSEAMHRFVQEVAADAAEHLTPDEVSHYVFNGALDLSWMGLVRYHRKRAEAAGQTATQ
jgi:glyoxylase-like metal-dependent hydrolase (beta-lactamase superfamily II)